MANPKILEKKQAIIDEIANNVKESSSFIFLENTGLTVAETMELRRKLRESGSLTLFAISSIIVCFFSNIFGFAIKHLLSLYR